MRLNRLLPVLGLCCALCSCDQVKKKLVTVLADKQPEQKAEPKAAPSATPKPATASPAASPGVATPAAPPAAAASEPVRELQEDDFAAFTATPDCVVIVDFHAEWCGPCRQLGPILDAIARESGGRVVVGKFNVDHCKGLAQREGVRGIPDVRIYRNGRKYDAFVGAPPESAVRESINAQVKALAAAPPPPPAPKPAPKAVHKSDLQSQPQKPAKPEAPAEPAKPAVPAPMPKDWLPPGMQRK